MVPQAVYCRHNGWEANHASPWIDEAELNHVVILSDRNFENSEREGVQTGKIFHTYSSTT